MQQNVGRTDRIVRLVVGAVIAVGGAAIATEFLTIGLGATATLAVGVVAFLLGLAVVTTGVLGTCFLYSVLGVDTTRTNGGSGTTPRL